jgi:hypothetical protein
VVTTALEADALKMHLIHEFDFNPRSLVVSDMPLVPFFLAWAEQVLWVAANSMVLCHYSCSGVKVVSLKSTGRLDLNLHSSDEL